MQSSVLLRIVCVFVTLDPEINICDNAVKEQSNMCTCLSTFGHVRLLEK